MYLIVNLFNDNTLNKRKYYLNNAFLLPVIETFSEYNNLKTHAIKACIGFMKTKNRANEHAYLLEVNNIVANDKEFSFEFNVLEQMEQTNERVNKNLYRLAAMNDWLEDNGYSPNVYILDKSEFDFARKGQLNKIKESSYTSKIQDLRTKNDWKGIISLFSPIEDIAEGHEVWNNVNDLFEIGFACSKLGEPHNDKTRDKEHLKEVEIYRNYSIRLYQRCMEIEPLDYRYVSALAYRHYLNVMELFKPKGRKDGDKDYEIEQAIDYFDKAISLNKGSIKDNYRLGKVILEYKINQMKYRLHEWNRGFFLELEEVEKKGVEALKKAITTFERLEEDKRRTYKNEYIRAAYCLGSYYMQKPDLHINEFIMSKISGVNCELSISNSDIEDIANARKYLEISFTSESEKELDETLEFEFLYTNQNTWKISPMDELYRLGVVYMYMYYIKSNFLKDKETANNYKNMASKLMGLSLQIASEGRKKNTIGRSTWFINDKYALLYILDENYSEAINLLKNARDAYIMNTLSYAYLLKSKDEVFDICLNNLDQAINNKFNMAKPISIAIMLYIYKQNGDINRYKKLFDVVGKSSNKYLECLGVSLSDC